MLLVTFGASLLGNILAGIGAIATRQERGVNRAGEGVIAKRKGREIVGARY